MRAFLVFALCLLLLGLTRLTPTLSQDRKPLAASQGPEPYVAHEDEVQKHRTGSHRAIRVPREQQENIFQAVRVTLVVDESGEVISAVAVEGPSSVFSRAVEEAMKWKYMPFEKDGEPTSAKFDDYVRILPPEELPKTHEAFPTINNLSGVVMTLSRSGCFGTCPAYSIEIRGDGSVTYKGEGFVVVTGEHRDHLLPEQVTEIVDAFRKADYFSLKDKYSYMVTDCPTYGTSFRIDQVEKAVTDYVGEEAGMPEAVSDLEMTIDRVAGTAKWIQGTAETVQALKKEGWDFKSPEAAKVLARASQEGRSDFVKDLLAAGVGLGGENENGNSALGAAALAGDGATVRALIKAGAGKNDPGMKTEALAGAAQSGDVELVRLLLDYGGDPKRMIQRERGSSTVLMAAANSGVPKIVEMILAQHPEVNARDEKGRTALWSISDASTYWDEKRHADRARLVHLLAQAGADLNAQDDQGDTALHSAYDAGVARALIEDGANVNIQNEKGETPLMTNFSADVAKLLVAAGADIHARNHEGKTALELSRGLEPDGDRTHYLESVSKGKTNN